MYPVEHLHPAMHLKFKRRSKHISGQITIIPKPELRGFWGDSLSKRQVKVTSAEVVIICPDICEHVIAT